jgi:branched-chain amino acid transport system substrate-binding protein
MKTFYAFLLAGVVCLAGCNKPQATDTILIGEYVSLSGSTATFGRSTDNAARIALDEANAAGGILGKKVALKVEDDQGKPEVAVNCVLKLIQRDKVVAVLGEVVSARSLAAAPICQQNKIPMLSPSSTNIDVTKKGDYIFRACFVDSFQGAVMAKFAANSLKAKTAAIFTDRKSDYSVGLTEFFKKTFTELGGQVVIEESYQADDREFKPQLTNIREKKTDIIYVPGYYTENALIAKQARELGMKQPLMGGDGWDSENTLTIGGLAVEPCYFSNHYSPEDPRPEVQAFVRKYQERYQTTPDALAVLGYDAMGILLDAIRRAGSTDPKAIRDALAATRDFKGVSGKITIDAERNARKDAVVLKVENGKFKFVQLMSP